MSVKDILHEIVDRIPFSETDRVSIKADIDNLDADTESPQTAEAATSGNDQGITTGTESSAVAGTPATPAETTAPPAPETPPAAEVGMGILPQDAVAATPAADDEQAETATETTEETTEANPTEGTPPAESPSGSAGS